MVKNVTGYDLARGLAGSWGTLAVLTEVTFKVLPAPGHEATLILRGLSDREGVSALCQAMGSPAEASAAAHLPAGIAATLGVGETAATAIRLEGFEGSVKYRAAALGALFAGVNEIDRLEGGMSRAFWAKVRDAEAFAGGEEPVWRVSVAPTAGPQVVAALSRHPLRWFYDWSGGLVWIAVEDGAGEGDALAGVLRAAIEAAGGGHATLVRGSPALRAAIPVFQPQPGPLAALSRRLKEQFDPLGILNPGRMAI